MYDKSILNLFKGYKAAPFLQKTEWNKIFLKYKKICFSFILQQN